MSKRIPMSTDERKRDKFGTRNQDSLENLPTTYSRELKNIDQKTLEVGVIFCEKCKKYIPVDYWRVHQQNHFALIRR